MGRLLQKNKQKKQTGRWTKISKQTETRRKQIYRLTYKEIDTHIDTDKLENRQQI